MVTKARAPTERWIAGRHVDRVLQALVAPVLTPDLPEDQHTAALQGGVTGLAVLAIARDESCREGLEARLDEADWLGAFEIAYTSLSKSGLLRPATLEEDEI